MTRRLLFAGAFIAGVWAVSGLVALSIESGVTAAAKPPVLADSCRVVAAEVTR